MNRRLGRVAGCLAVTVALLVGPAIAPATAGPRHSDRAADRPADRATASSQLPALLRSGVQDLHDLGVVGVQGLARQGDHTAEARAGVGDLATGAPVPRNGYFRMGSNTKTFAAVIALQLVGEGRLSLDDSVQRWLPGLVTGNGNDGRRITVRQLLQHTSGLPNYTEDLTIFSSAHEYRARRFDHYEPAELVALAVRHQPLFAPGTHWSYSNTNYILVGMIIEKVTGRSWAVELRDRILRPLDLRQTYSPGDRPDLPRPYAKAYHQFAPGEPLVDTTLFNTTAAYAAGDLVTAPADLGRFWQALQRGRLLRPAQLAEMRRTVLAETFQDYVPGGRYGLGVMWIPNRCGGYWSHGGDVLGTSTGNGVTGDGDRVVVLSQTTQLADEQAAITVIQRANRLVEDVLCVDR